MLSTLLPPYDDLPNFNPMFTGEENISSTSVISSLHAGTGTQSQTTEQIDKSEYNSEIEEIHRSSIANIGALFL